MSGRRGWPWLVLLALNLGCSIAPRKFFDLTDPAPLVRARAVNLGEELPESVVIPALLDRLNDPDPVVRLSAHENLKQRTGLDFGYVPWGDPVERGQGVARWRSWWDGRQAGLAKNRRIP